MKKLSLLLALVLIVTTIFSCGDTQTTAAEPAPLDLLNAAMSIFTAEESFEPSIYYQNADKSSDNYLDPGTMSFYFLGEYDLDIPEMALVEDYALALNTSYIAFEINIFKAKSTAAAKEIQGLLNKRHTIKEQNRGEINNYDPSQIKILDELEIFVSGKYVFLIATSNNSGVKEKINELFGADSGSVGDKAESDESTAPKIADALSHVNTNLGGGNSSVVSAPKKPDASERPEMTVTSFSAVNRVVLGGRCSQGAKIVVKFDDTELTFGTDYNSWLCEVEIPNEGVTNLYVYQVEEGKSESLPIVVTAQPKEGVDFAPKHGVCQVAIGDNFQGHFFGQIADWCGTNLLSDKQIDGVTSRIKEKVDYLASRNCELVYVIVPNPMRVYPETVPSRYVQSDKDTSRTEQFEQCAQNAGATVVDLFDILNEHRDDEFKIFNKMDSHWTDYGAYFGYYALMDKISEKWPDAKPLEIEGNFEFYTKEVDAGDMMTHLELKNSLIQEVATFGKFLIEAVDKPDLYYTNRNELNFDPVKGTKTVTNTLSDADLPTAMVIRDSFGTNMYPYLNNAFSEVYYQSMWDYKFNKSYIERTNPDYYIVLVAERNISNLLG